MANYRLEATRNRPSGPLDARPLLGLSDGQLLARFARHRDELSEAAFTALVHRHGPMVLRVCCRVVGDRHVAEDAFQATFLVLARRAGAIRQPELLANWLNGVALRTAREARLRNDRRRRRELVGRNDLEDSFPSKGDRPERTVAVREELEVLHEEVARLPERYRTAVILCELEGLDYQEAALRMQCPVGTVGVRLRRARERLRVRLARRGLAPAAAILGALAGAEAASAWMTAALVRATARAAIRYAGTGLASGAVAAIATAVLRDLARARFRTALRAVLAVGAGAALGWFAVRHTAWRPPSPAQAATGRLIESGSSINAPLLGTTQAAASIDPGPVTATASTPATSAATAPAQPVTATMVNRKPAPDLAGEAIVPGWNARSHRADDAVRPDLPAHVRQERAMGEALFARQWVRNDPASHGGDGLGPVFNEMSCIACHGLASPGGAGPDDQNVVILTAVPNGRKLPDGLERIHPAFRNSPSIVLHRFGTHPDYAAWREQFRDPLPEIVPEPVPAPADETVEQRITRIRQETSQGRRPRIHEWSAAPRGIRMTLTERNSPALFGAGQIDAIPADALAVVAGSQPDRVRGRVGRTSRGATGRFGWKAQVASLHEFVRGACASEIGLQVPGHAQAVSPVGPTSAADGVDMTRAECDALVAYVRALPAPRALSPPTPEARREITAGRDHFTRVGCAECHRPSVGLVEGIFSDLLLHRMGADLDDPGSGYGNEGRPLPDGPSPGEWRTPPLWGFRDSAPYLHDGRARNLEQAVALHGGQGSASARRFFALAVSERTAVEAFLNSLVAPTRAGMPRAGETVDQVPAIEAEAAAEAEVLVRHHRQSAINREERQSQAVLRQKRDEAAAKQAGAKLPIAFQLDALGKTEGALFFYQQVAKIAPDSREGRLATDRITELTGDRTPQ